MLTMPGTIFDAEVANATKVPVDETLCWESARLEDWRPIPAVVEVTSEVVPVAIAGVAKSAAHVSASAQEMAATMSRRGTRIEYVMPVPSHPSELVSY
jgi:hypothetical protein